MSTAKVMGETKNEGCVLQSALSALFRRMTAWRAVINKEATWLGIARLDQNLSENHSRLTIFLTRRQIAAREILSNAEAAV